MATCGRCGAPLTPGGHYCRTCGTPVAVPDHGPRPDWRPPPQVLPAPTPTGPAPRPPRPARGGPRPALVAGAVLAVLAVGGAATGVILRDADPSAATTPTFALPPPTPVPVATPSPSARPTAPSTADPVDLLRRQLDADTATVESLVGKWIPQLSSKREGDLVDGTRYDAAAVLDDFNSWKEQVPSSVLTRSERFTSFRGQGYWVTLAAEPFDTPEAANAWCDTEGIAPGDCFAKRLSYTEGPGGNTRPR